MTGADALEAGRNSRALMFILNSLAMGFSLLADGAGDAGREAAGRRR